jgi:hypothetical protein
MLRFCFRSPPSATASTKIFQLPITLQPFLFPTFSVSTSFWFSNHSILTLMVINYLLVKLKDSSIVFLFACSYYRVFYKTTCFELIEPKVLSISISCLCIFGNSFQKLEFPISNSCTLFYAPSKISSLDCKCCMVRASCWLVICNYYNYPLKVVTSCRLLCGIFSIASFLVMAN